MPGSSPCWRKWLPPGATGAQPKHCSITPAAASRPWQSNASNSTGKFGGFFAVDLGATYKLAKNVSLEFQVKNLTDRYYEYVWWDGVQSLHSPADERSFHAAVSISF